VRRSVTPSFAFETSATANQPEMATDREDHDIGGASPVVQGGLVLAAILASEIAAVSIVDCRPIHFVPAACGRARRMIKKHGRRGQLCALENLLRHR
jgi:hypothetical protein